MVVREMMTWLGAITIAFPTLNLWAENMFTPSSLDFLLSEPDEVKE